MSKPDETLFRQMVGDPAVFRANIIVDRDGTPDRFSNCIEPWQDQDFRRCDPGWRTAIGSPVAGASPRAYLERARGHSKTTDIAVSVTWAMVAARRPLRGFCAACDTDQARLLVDAIAKLVRLNPWLTGILEIQREVIRNIAPGHPGQGSELRVMSADAASSFGLLPDFIVCDELTHWAKPDLFYSLLSSAAKRSTCMFQIISNAGFLIENDWRWRAREAARQSVDWVFSSLRGAQASWISAKSLAEQRAMLTTAAYKRLWLNEWVTGSECPLLSPEVIARAVDSCLWPVGYVPEDERAAELFIGIDIGRTRDRTVIYTFQLKKDRCLTREVCVLHQVPFAQQKIEIQKRMTRNVIKAYVDKGAIGMQLAEELQAQYGGRCEGIQLSSQRQGQMAMQVRSQFDRGLVVIPDDADLRADLQLVDQVETVNGVPSIKTNRGTTGHADRFWALALALHAMPIQRPNSGTGGRPRAVVLGGRDGSLPFVPGMVQSSRFGSPFRGAMGRDQ